MDAMARNPPAQNTPSIFYGTMDTLLAAGAAGAFSNRPSDVFGVQRDAHTPTSYNYSIGIQRELGWGTVLDVTYAGFQMRRAEIAKSINSVPDGARFVDQNPQNANPQNPTTAKPNEFLRPYLGYQNITVREHYGTGYNNSLQVQLNRRYIRGLQFAVAYTLAKTITDGTAQGIPTQNSIRLGKAWNEGPASFTQLHNFVASYTWDIPGGSRLWNHWFSRGVLDGWQFSGDTAIVSGDWMGLNTITTTDNADITGSDVAARANFSGDALCTSGNCDATPGSGGSYLNIAAYSRPARGQPGDAPVTFFRMPKIVLSNMSIFKNFELGAGKRIQFRWEAYNVFNQVNWSEINRTPQFNAAGEQVNANFGQATTARDARVMQGAIRFSF
jgi:hypothetical protein